MICVRFSNADNGRNELIGISGLSSVWDKRAANYFGDLFTYFVLTYICVSKLESYIFSAYNSPTCFPITLPFHQFLTPHQTKQFALPEDIRKGNESWQLYMYQEPCRRNRKNQENSFSCTNPSRFLAWK